MIAIDSPADGGTVRLSHPMYGEAVRASMPACAAASCGCGSPPACSERDAVQPDDALRIARWLLDAGEPVPAAAAARRGRRGQRGRRPGPRRPPRAAGRRRRRRRARRAAAGPRPGIARRYEAAEAVLASLEGRIDDEELAIDYLEARAYLLLWHLNRPAELPGLLERAEQWWPEAEWRGASTCCACTSRWSPATPRRWRPRRRRRSPIPTSDPVLRRQMEPVHGEQPVRQRARATRAGSWLRDSGRRCRSATRATRWRSRSGIASRRRPGSRGTCCCASCRRCSTEAIAADDDAAAAITAFALGNLTVRQGRFRDAIRWLTEAESPPRRRRRPRRAADRARQSGARGGRDGRRRRDAGRPRGARDGARRARPAPRAARTPGAGVRVVRATSTATTRARRRRTSSPPRRRRRSRRSRRCCCSTRCASAVLEAPGRAAAGAERPLRRAAGPRLRRPRCGLRRRRRWCAARGVRRLRADRRDAAVPRWSPPGTPPPASCARGGRTPPAAPRRAAARSTSPTRAGRRRRCPGSTAPRSELTRREAQLAALAARGLTNAEIADRLVLSVRTVESHVYRAMHKLGVNDRRQLPTTQ